MSKQGSLFSAIAIMVGTAIGAGIFGIPYAISRVGFFWGLIYFLVLGVFIIISTLCYSEVVLRTKKRMYFAGYAEKYLGKWGKVFGLIAMVVGIYSALVAYTIQVGHFLFLIFSPYFGGVEIVYSLIFFVVCSIVILFGLGLVAGVERVMVILLFIVMVAFFIFGLKQFEFPNLLTSTASGFKDFFLPYGVILFALGASSAVPEMEVLLKKNKKRLKKAIILGLTIPLIVYVVFAFIVVGVTGVNTTEGAVGGMGQSVGETILTIGAIFGILAMTTSFLSLGVILKDSYIFDFKVNKYIAWLLVIIVPLIIFLLNIVNFVEVLGIAGTIMGGLEGILIVAMFLKAKKMGTEKKPAYELKFPKVLLFSMVGIFIVGIIYQIVMIF